MKRGIIDIHLLKALIARDKEGSNLKLINLLLSYGTNFKKICKETTTFPFIQQK